MLDFAQRARVGGGYLQHRFGADGHACHIQRLKTAASTRRCSAHSGVINLARHAARARQVQPHPQAVLCQCHVPATADEAAAGALIRRQAHKDVRQRQRQRQRREHAISRGAEARVRRCACAGSHGTYRTIAEDRIRTEGGLLTNDGGARFAVRAAAAR